MNSYGTLPVTGAGVTLFGVMFDQAWLLIFGLAVVFGGAMMIRHGWRRGKSVGEL